MLSLVESAVAAGVTFVQLREKHLSAGTLYELAARAASLTGGSDTRLLVNDRADIACAAHCDGVHLTTQSIPTPVVRRAFGADFLIGVSTHTLTEARAARDEGADFVVFGPVFDTPSKRDYGSPPGLDALGEAALSLSPFPVVALGGINTVERARDCLRTGASGVAAIRLFGEAANLREIVREIEATAGI